MIDPTQYLLSVIACTVTAVLDEHYRALEQACEEALQGGEHGVLVDWKRNIYQVDPRVPYGRIYDVTACGEENVRLW